MYRTLHRQPPALFFSLGPFTTPVPVANSDNGKTNEDAFHHAYQDEYHWQGAQVIGVVGACGSHILNLTLSFLLMIFLNLKIFHQYTFKILS